MTSTDGQSGASAAETATARRPLRRLPLLIVLVVLLVAAVVAGNGHSPALPGVTASVPTDAVTMPAASARSTAWYCPGGPPSRLLAGAPERISVANLETRPVDVAVTVVPDKGGVVHGSARAPARTTIPIGTAGQAAANSAVIVEPFAAKVAVQSSSSAPGVVASAPCATQPATAWHFAQGTTLRGTQDWIVLFNPFGDDAIVDMAFYTGSGFARPNALQGKTVPRRSRVIIPVHSYVHYQRTVATTITTRTGRIVAQQTIVYGSNGRAAGVTRTLGAVATALQWVFPTATANAKDVRTIGISDPSDNDAQAYVQVTPTDGSIVQPVTVSVARNGVTTVQIGACTVGSRVNCIPVKPGLPYSVLVHATRNVGFVAQDLSTWADGRNGGANALVGNTAAARQWVFPAALGTPGTAALTVLNSQATTAHVTLSFVASGRSTTVSGLRNATVKPNGQLVVSLSSLAPYADGNATVVVTADTPVVAQRAVARSDDVAIDLGVPVRG